MLTWETTVEGTVLKASAAAALDDLINSLASASETEASTVTVVDLRKVNEISGQADLVARLKEKSIAYVPIPVTPETFSEQDVDAFRRECLRKRSQIWTVCSDGQRSVFMNVANVARAKQWTYEVAIEKAPDLNHNWQAELKGYLARHQRA
jgi:protein tyrosine phosphatase (PTP) superfamily phosphohydrolase (DUF442 family)